VNTSTLFVWSLSSFVLPSANFFSTCKVIFFCTFSAPYPRLSRALPRVSPCATYRQPERFFPLSAQAMKAFRSIAGDGLPSMGLFQLSFSTFLPDFFPFSVSYEASPAPLLPYSGAFLPAVCRFFAFHMAGCFPFSFFSLPVGCVSTLYHVCPSHQANGAFLPLNLQTRRRPLISEPSSFPATSFPFVPSPPHMRFSPPSWNHLHALLAAFSFSHVGPPSQAWSSLLLEGDFRVWGGLGVFFLFFLFCSLDSPLSLCCAKRRYLSLGTF